MLKKQRQRCWQKTRVFQNPSGSPWLERDTDQTKTQINDPTLIFPKTVNWLILIRCPRCLNADMQATRTEAQSQKRARSTHITSAPDSGTTHRCKPTTNKITNVPPRCAITATFSTVPDVIMGRPKAASKAALRVTATTNQTAH